MASFDLIIKNGTVLDGLSNEGRLADVGIKNDEIAAVGNLAGASTGQVLEADGFYVVPGFIDIQNHSDSYFTLLEIPHAPSMLAQGITTICVGHCGSSLAPLPSPEALKSIQKWRSLAGTNINWLSFEEYFETLKNYPLGVNVASLVGHSTVRRGLLGDQVRSANLEELGIINKLVRESLAAGAAGVSLGLVYAHESNASEEELMSAARAAGEANRLYSVHLRSEGSGVVDAVNEAIGFAQKSGATTKISHFKIRGEKNWRFLDEALSAIDRAYQSGTRIFFDVYPYVTSWTVLYTFLPKWAYEGGRAAILKNLKDRTKRKKILDYLKSMEQDLGSIFIATSETNPSLVGKTLHQVAVNQEISVEEALLNIVTATNAQVVVFDRNLSGDVLNTLLKHPLSVVATDGAGYDFKYHPMHGLAHPRCFGAMPKFLSMVRDEKLMSWPDAVKKITSEPAKRLGLKDRGTLKEGMRADVVVFDPRDVGSTAFYENPYQRPRGIQHVILNGRLAHSLSEAPEDEAAGRLLRF